MLIYIRAARVIGNEMLDKICIIAEDTFLDNCKCEIGVPTLDSYLKDDLDNSKSQNRISFTHANINEANDKIVAIRAKQDRRFSKWISKSNNAIDDFDTCNNDDFAP